MTPVQAAAVAAEAVRDLNRVTLSGGYEWPGEVDAVLAELAVLGQRLPQAIGQGAGWLARQHTAGRVAHDTPGVDVNGTVLDAVTTLRVAVEHADALTRALDQARQHTAHLRGNTS